MNALRYFNNHKSINVPGERYSKLQNTTILKILKVSNEVIK